MPTGTTFLIIDPPDTPNIGRYKINYNFALLLSGSFSAITGVSASVFTNPNPTTQTVGGVLAGSTFAGNYYLQDMMDLLLYPAVTPNFTSFLMAAQATDLEVGVATPTTANFTWAIANATDLAANSISITDTTSSTLLATGLANDGAESVFTGAISKTTPSSNIWTIAADDTDGNPFSRAFTINWSYMVFYGSSASLTLNAAAIVALSGSELTTDIDGSYALGGSNYGYLCAPNAFSTPNGFRDSSTNLPIEMAGPSDGYTSFDGAFYYSPVSVNRNGVVITYRVYRTRNTTTASSMSVGVTGGTTATLQSVINAGNTAIGDAAVLGSFSAITFYSGNTELSTLLSAGSATRVQPGTNTTTGGTPSAPTVNVVPSPSFTSVFATSISAVTFYSGATDLGTLLGSISTPTRVQPGTNTTTGGTASAPTVNVVPSPSFTSVFAASISATTFYSGNTDLSQLMGSSLPTASDGEMLYNSGGTWVHRDMSIRASDDPLNWIIVGNNGNSFVNANEACGIFAGAGNAIDNSVLASILGGSNSVLQSATCSTMVAGDSNSIQYSNYSAIIGGISNALSSDTAVTSIMGASYDGINASGIILGGGANFLNTAIDCTIINGATNRLMNGVYSSIVGGNDNVMDGVVSCFVTAGETNTIRASYYSSIIGSLESIIVGATESSILAGSQNTITGSSANAVVLAGSANIIDSSDGSSIIGGSTNALDSVVNSSIIGGDQNTISDSLNSVLIGGLRNLFISDTGETQVMGLSYAGKNTGSFIAGGMDNLVDTAIHSSILNGGENTLIRSAYSTVVNGFQNNITTGYECFITGGETNIISGNSYYSTIIGANENLIIGATTSSIFAGSINSITGITNDSAIMCGAGHFLHGTQSSAIIGGLSNSLFGTQGSVIIGGSGIVGTEDNTLYTDKMSANAVRSITVSATTFYSGGTDLSLLLNGGAATYVQDGTNTTTGGTPSRPTVNVSPTPSFTSVSAATFYSGSTDLSLLLTGGAQTRVQPGTNITTGGTASAPTINVVPNPVFTSVSALTITATTIYSGGTDLSLLLTGGAQTRVQPGTNVTTGGTTSAPIVSVVSNPAFTSVSATTVTATTFYSGTTELGQLMINSWALGVSTNTTSPKTPALTDGHSLMILSSATVFNFYIPTHADVAFPIGTQIMLKQGGAGQVRVSGSTGVTLYSYGNAYNLVGQHATSFLTKESQNTWVMDGNLTTLSL